MPRKPEPKPDNAEQSKRFIETAEQVGADDEKTLERAFKRILLPRSRSEFHKRQNQEAAQEEEEKD